MTIITPDATVRSKEYVKVTDGQGGPTIGVAKISPDGTANIILFPECPVHGKPTKVTMSLGLDFPLEVPR